MTLFTGRDLTCIRSERTVFEGLGFSLGVGDALVLSGPNGSGKSSLLRLMCGLLAPVGGDILWGGAPISEDREQHNVRLHYIGHHDAVKPVLTAAENVAFWSGLGGGGGRPGAIAALDAFGLSHLADVPCRFLSAGQKRRVALARLHARPAALWLLDEPATSLDKDSTEALGRAIETHRAGGGLVAVATHFDLGLADAQVLDLGAARETVR